MKSTAYFELPDERKMYPEELKKMLNDEKLMIIG